MNAGLSPNKCLISKSCHYPHHCYYYKGTDLGEMMGENRGAQGLTGWGREEFSGQANRDSVIKMRMQKPVQEEMGRPAPDKLSSADGLELCRWPEGGLEAGKDVLGSKEPWVQNTGFAFPDCEAMRR